MNLFEWLGGYKPSLIQRHLAEQREPIAKIGVAVLFASLVAAGNWGIAGWSYAADLASEQRMTAALLAAGAGLVFVLVIDRLFIYWMDTAYDASKWLMALFGVLRISVIIAVSSLTSQAVMPVFLHSDLAITALQMQESNDKQRAGDLSQRFDLAGKRSALIDANQQLTDAQQAINNLPTDIQQQLAQAKNCWQRYGQQKAALVKQGHSKQEAREQLRSVAARCQHQETAAHQAQAHYLSDARAQLQQVSTAQQTQQSTLSTADAQVQAKLQAAGAIEQQAYNEHSTEVLWHMITTKPAAFAKWLTINFVLLVSELFPLLMKTFAGQSTIGRTIAANKRRDRIKVDNTVQQLERDYQVASAVNLTAQAAVQQALADPAMRAVFAAQFAEYIKALAPLEAARALWREVEERATDVDELVKRHPQYGQVIMAAWSNAIRDTISILSNNGAQVAGQSI